CHEDQAEQSEAEIETSLGIHRCHAPAGRPIVVSMQSAPPSILRTMRTADDALRKPYVGEYQPVTSASRAGMRCELPESTRMSAFTSGCMSQVTCMKWA